ncbi:hypothetical protein ABK730_24080 [Klebsiella indica]
MNRILLMCLMSTPHYALADMACSKLVLSGVSEAYATYTDTDTPWLNLRDTAYLRAVVYDNSSSAVPADAWRIAADSKICTSETTNLRCAHITGSAFFDDQHHHLTYTRSNNLQPGGSAEQTAHLRLQFDESRQVPSNPPYRILIEDSYSHVFSVSLGDIPSMEITTATWNTGVNYMFPAISAGETTEAQLIPPPSGGSGTLRRVSDAATSGMTVRFNDAGEEPERLTIQQGQSTSISMVAAPDAEPGAYSRVYEATLNCP